MKTADDQKTFELSINLEPLLELLDRLGYLADIRLPSDPGEGLRGLPEDARLLRAEVDHSGPWLKCFLESDTAQVAPYVGHCCYRKVACHPSLMPDSAPLRLAAAQYLAYLVRTEHGDGVQGDQVAFWSLPNGYEVMVARRRQVLQQVSMSVVSHAKELPYG